MSFPLSQDVGYDPTIYTAPGVGSPALVRDVTSYGERLLRVGMARPLMFHVTPSSSFRIVYDFETCGRIVGLHFTLGAADGRRYNHSLSFQTRRPRRTRWMAANWQSLPPARTSKSSFLRPKLPRLP